MSLSIRLNNYGSLIRAINFAHADMYRAAERISSGLLINRASDNPAGLVISEQLRSQIAAINQNIENTNNLIRKYETASSTVNQMHSYLTELRSMAVGAANEGGNSPEAQQAYARLAEHTVASYNRVLETADYNGVNLLDGGGGSVASIENLDGIDLSSAEAAEQSIAVIDEAAAALDQQQVEIGAYQKNELESRLANMQTTLSNLQAAESQIRDADIVTEVSNFIAANIRARAGIAMMAHLFMSNKTVLALLDH
jgi:flagellin